MVMRYAEEHQAFGVAAAWRVGSQIFTAKTPKRQKSKRGLGLAMRAEPHPVHGAKRAAPRSRRETRRTRSRRETRFDAFGACFVAQERGLAALCAVNDAHPRSHREPYPLALLLFWRFGVLAVQSLRAWSVFRAVAGFLGRLVTGPARARTSTPKAEP
jgi:hypothetical protein